MGTHERDKDLPFEISATTAIKICQMLNLRNDVGGDFKELSAKLGMSINEMDISQRSEDPTREILRWWGSTSEASVQNLLKVLKEMRRHDAIRILKRDPMVLQALGNWIH